MVKYDPLKKILRDLRNIKGVNGAAIIDKNGLVTCNDLPDWTPPGSIREIGADIIKITHISNRVLKQGIFKSAMMDFEKGRFLFTRVSDKILVISAAPTAQMGILQTRLPRKALVHYGPENIYMVECEYCKKDHHEKDILEITVDEKDNFEWWCRICSKEHSVECNTCSRLLKKELIRGGKCALCGELLEK